MFNTKTLVKIGLLCWIAWFAFIWFNVNAAPSNNRGWIDSCSWDNPGQSPYQHRPLKALLSYEISTEQRHDLTAKMAQLRYDDVATITRDGVVSDKGAAEYTNLRAMHFGDGRVCRTVTRTKWTPAMKEVGLVYCSVAGGRGEVCVIVPTVCNNVSLVDKRVLATKASGGPGEGLGALMEPVGYLGTAPEPMDATEVAFEPPGSGATPVSDPVSYVLPPLVGVYQTSPIPGGVYPIIHLPPEPPPVHPPILPPPPVPGIPEPGTWLLLGFGLAVLLRLRRP